MAKRKKKVATGRNAGTKEHSGQANKKKPRSVKKRTRASSAGGDSSSTATRRNRPAEKKPRRDSKAQAVRDYLREHPQATNREIVTELSHQGIVIDDYLPAAIRSENTPAGLRRRAAKTKKKPPADGTPVVRLHAPLYEDFVKDMVKAKVHTAVVKSIRVLCARLERIVDIVEALKDDDWEIQTFPEIDGLMFSARHRLVTTEAQATARIAKLGIKPNEVDLVLEPKKLQLEPEV